MKKKFFTSTLTAFCVLCLLAGCENTGKAGNEFVEKETSLNELQGTKWKLVGIVDAKTSNLKILEPREYEKCYTLAFDNSIPYCNEDDINSFSTRSSTNELGGCYVIDYEKQHIQVLSFGGTKINEIGDGKLFCDALRTIQSFSLQKNELRMYYNNKQNYLLFKQTQP